MQTPPLAELDSVQVVIIVIAMIGGFLHWLWNLIQQGKAEFEKRRQQSSPEEKKRREEAWRRQTQGQPQNRPAQRPAPASPPVNDPFASVRDLFEQIKRETQEAQRPPPLPQGQPGMPPPLPPSTAPVQPPPRRGSVRSDLSRMPAPQPVRRHSVAADVEKRPSTTPPVSLPVAPEPPPVLLPTVAPLAASRPTMPPAWVGLLGSPAALRQAFILREILGPPKALQNTSDSAA